MERDAGEGAGAARSSVVRAAMTAYAARRMAGAGRWAAGQRGRLDGARGGVLEGGGSVIQYTRQWKERCAERNYSKCVVHTL